LSAPPDVTVVTPTFRRPGPLVQAVRSALAQEGVRVEILVLDDSPEGSGCVALADLGDARVTVRQRPIPSGGRPAVVRNEGLAEARGRYVHFLDDDDRLPASALQTLVGVLDRRPEVAVAWGRVTPFGDHPAVLEQQTRYFEQAATASRRLAEAVAFRRSRIVARLLFRTTLLVNSSCLVRRECAQEVGGYAADVPLCEDVDFFMRSIRHGGGVFVDAPVLEYRTGAPSLMHDLTGTERVAESYRVIHRNYRRRYGAGEMAALKVLARLDG
jgi:glycosyltransferase involved in cell wall biosynthesis